MHRRKRFKLRRVDLINFGNLGKAALPTLFTAALLFSSCGYRMAGQTTGLPESIKTIAITVFENESFEPNIEAAITRAVTQKFVDDGRLRVVPKARADALLTGTVIKYELDALSFDQFNYATSYRLKLSVTVTLKGSGESSLRMVRNVNAESFYSLGSSIAGAESTRLAAIDSVSRIIADNIIGLFLEVF